MDEVTPDGPQSDPRIKVLLCNPPWFNGDGDHEKEAIGGEVKFVENILNEYKTDKRDDIYAFCFLIGQKRAQMEIMKMLKNKFRVQNCWKVKMDQGAFKFFTRPIFIIKFLDLKFRK